MLWIDNNLWRLWCAGKAPDEKLNWGPTTLCAGKAPDKKLNWGQAIYALALPASSIVNLDVS